MRVPPRRTYTLVGDCLDKLDDLTQGGCIEYYDALIEARECRVALLNYPKRLHIKNARVRDGFNLGQSWVHLGSSRGPLDLIGLGSIVDPVVGASEGLPSTLVLLIRGWLLDNNNASYTPPFSTNLNLHPTFFPHPLSLSLFLTSYPTTPTPNVSPPSTAPGSRISQVRKTGGCASQRLKKMADTLADDFFKSTSTSHLPFGLFSLLLPL